MTNQQKINEAVMKAVGKKMPSASQMKRQAEKDAEKRKKELGKMVSRQEMMDYVQPIANALAEAQTNLQLLYIQNLTFHKLAKDNWGLTDEQLDKLITQVRDEFYAVSEEDANEEANEEASN